MKVRILFVLLSLFVALSQTSAQQNNAQPNWKPVDDAMGRAGQDQPDGARRYAMPRSDLKVTAGGVDLKAGFALGSWAAFHHMGSHTAVMGDLGLPESELGPVRQKLVESEMEMTAVH